jgi:hypothetical protein
MHTGIHGAKLVLVWRDLDFGLFREKKDGDEQELEG